MTAFDILRKVDNKFSAWQCRFRRRRLAASANPRPGSAPYISGDTFRALADHVLDDAQPQLDPGSITAGQLVFVSTWYLDDFCARILPLVDVPFTLITHNSDLPVDTSHLPYVDDRIRAWFAQNCLVVHPKIVPVPIGLENQHFQNNGRTAIFDALRGKVQPADRLDRILFGFSVRTNREEREPAYRYLTGHPLCDEHHRTRSAAYLRRLAHYKFVAAPPGNGIDTHRAWEAMYLRVVPIVKRSAPMTAFENLGLPIWQVDDWRELDGINTTSLRDHYAALAERFDAPPLFMEYWRQRILEPRENPPARIPVLWGTRPEMSDPGGIGGEERRES